MIEFEPTKYAAGAYIWGDYRDLRALHSSIHDIIEAAPYGETHYQLGALSRLRYTSLLSGKARAERIRD